MSVMSTAHQGDANLVEGRFLTKKVTTPAPHCVRGSAGENKVIVFPLLVVNLFYTRAAEWARMSAYFRAKYRISLANRGLVPESSETINHLVMK